jgi:transposase
MGMARPALRIEVSTKDQKSLRTLVNGGVQQVRVVLRALALLQLARGVAAPRIAQMIPLTPQAIRNLGRRYQQGGLERALYEKQRPGAAEILDQNQKQRLIAMVCSSPPEGRARWTVRLVAEEAVKRKLVPQVGRETVRILLLSHDLKPWREKNVGVRRDKPACWCVQRRLAYSVGGSPTRATVRSPVAWIVRRKETESRKPIDKAIERMVSEPSGRNRINAQVASKR